MQLAVQLLFYGMLFPEYVTLYETDSSIQNFWRFMIKLLDRSFSLVGFYGISTIEGYLKANPLYTY